MKLASLNKIAQHPLQTSHWAEFRKAWGNEILETKYGILTLHRIPKTKYKIGVFIKGPEPTSQMLAGLKKIGEENNLIFIKLEPCVEKSSKLVRLMENAGVRPGKTLFTPSTFWIDLTKSEEELLKSFTSKTRYNIRLAERKGVQIVEDNSDAAFEKYLKLMRETVERQRFYAHSEKYHRLMWKYLHTDSVQKNKQPVARLLLAKFDKVVLTAWVLFVWKDTLYYPYGAFSGKHKEVMANNLMMWEAIKYGKKNKLKTFDLWGREEGKGFTKFKEGYNPAVVEFLGTWDLVINKPLYGLYRLLDTGRWMVLRGKSRFTSPRF